MKHIFALGTVILSGVLLSAACTASDSDGEPDTTENFGGAGGTSNNGGTSSAENTVNAATSGGGSGGSNGGSGGTYSSGGSGGTAGGAGMGDGGWAGEETTTTESTTGWETTTTGSGGSGGAPFECLGDDDVDDLPDCDDLEYAEVVCEDFDPPEPFGVTHCKQFATHATPEAFDALFDCLDDVDEDDACGEAHDDAVRVCRDGDATNDGVVPLTCESELAREKCANLGCPEVDTEVDGECDVYLSTFTPAGVDHVIACANDNTNDEPGGSWGAGPDTTGCGEVFLQCVAGILQPTH